MSDSDAVYAVVKSEVVASALLAMPGFFNAAFNRQLRSIGGEFGRRFTSERLNGQGIKVRRQGNVNPQKGKGQIFLPKKMRLAGFKAELLGEVRLEGKRLSIRTSNPVMLLHETGGTVRAGSGKGRRQWLTVRFREAFSRLSPEDRRKSFVIRPKGGQPLLVTVAHGHGKKSLGERLIPFAILVKQVRMKPKLQFMKTWDSYAETATLKLDKGISDAMKRFAGQPRAGE